MDYEKKYKEALERARKIHHETEFDYEKGMMEEIFPEIKDSEDERIMKAIKGGIKHLETQLGYDAVDGVDILDIYSWLEKQGKETSMFPNIEDDVRRRSTIQVLEYARSLDTYNQYGKADIDKNIAWLEKQNEQPTDKVEPKFKVGDWIILPLGIIARIDSINSTDYQVTTTDGKICDFKISKQDNYRLWSITDAKDGDLIYVSTETKGLQAIFHKFENGIIYFHCNLCGDFAQGGYELSGDVKSVNPLLKEHYQRFFQKMKKAGYEWDAEKKELKKIEPKMLDADKVIGWLRKYWPFNVTLLADDVIEKFKKDFGL